MSELGTKPPGGERIVNAIAVFLWLSPLLVWIVYAFIPPITGEGFGWGFVAAIAVGVWAWPLAVVAQIVLAAMRRSRVDAA